MVTWSRVITLEEAAPRGVVLARLLLGGIIFGEQSWLLNFN